MELLPPFIFLEPSWDLLAVVVALLANSVGRRGPPYSCVRLWLPATAPCYQTPVEIQASATRKHFTL